MEHRTRRNHPLHHLISQYEAMTQNGELSYLDENDFNQVIAYYEDEYLLDEALQAAEHAISQHSFCADFLLIKARLLLRNSKPYLAMRFLDRASLIAPFELDVYLLRAKTFGVIGDFEQALSILHDARRFAIGSDMIDVYMCESGIYEQMKDYEQMFQALASALYIDPTHEVALERIWVSAELSKQYTASIKLHTELTDLDPYSYLAWFNLGHAYACIGEYRKAIDAIEYSFLINDDFQHGYQDCAELCCQERLYSRALAIYQDMVARFGADSDDLVKIAECQFFMEHYEACMDTLIEAVKLDQYNDEVYYFLGMCFRQDGKFQNAVNALTKAVELEQRREEYYAELALAYSDLGEHGKADFYFRKATEIGPEQEYYWIQHAQFLMRIDEYAKALEVVEEADYHTFGAELLFCKAICLLKLDFRRRALKVLDEALVEDFKMHTILYDFCPSLMEDKEISSMVRYYQGERVDSFTR